MQEKTSKINTEIRHIDIRPWMQDILEKVVDYNGGDEYMEKWSHPYIIYQVTSIELAAIDNIISKDYKLKLDDDMVISKDMLLPLTREEVKQNISNIQREYFYVHDDPTMLLSMSDDGLEIFRYILCDLLTSLILSEEITPIMYQHFVNIGAMVYKMDRERNNLDHFENMGDFELYFRGL